MTTASDNVFPKVILVEGAAPATPSANQVKLYAKSDGLLYSKDDAGAETLVSGGAGGLSDHNHTGGGDGGDLDAPIIDGYAVFNEESAPSTPSSGTVAVYAKADGLMYSKDDAGTETLMSGGAGGGGGGTGLLAVKAYAPGSDTTVGTASSTTLVDVDATNAAVTFTAPASGNVLVHLAGLTGPTGGSGGVSWGVRESTSIVAGPVLLWPVSSTAAQGFTAAFYITGVSAGSHTYKFAYAIASGTVALYAGPGYGKLVMEVWAAP